MSYHYRLKSETKISQKRFVFLHILIFLSILLIALFFTSIIYHLTIPNIFAGHTQSNFHPGQIDFDIIPFNLSVFIKFLTALKSIEIERLIVFFEEFIVISKMKHANNVK
jgi:hypothetical protein